MCAFFIRPTLIPPPFLALFWMVVLLRVQISRFVLRYLLLRARAHNPSATPLLSSLAHAPFLCSLILILLFKQSSPYFRRLSQYTRSHSRASESPPVRALVCSGLPWDTCRNAAPPPRLFFFTYQRLRFAVAETVFFTQALGALSCCCCYFSSLSPAVASS